MNRLAHLSAPDAPDRKRPIGDTAHRTRTAAGVRELADRGAKSKASGSPALVVLSDGPKPDGSRSSARTGGTGTYPFREIEYAYTYGQPPADSLASSFLNYMGRGNGQDVIRTHGHLPCAPPKGLLICGED